MNVMGTFGKEQPLSTIFRTFRTPFAVHHIFDLVSSPFNMVIIF
jgi:hypothetical protein